jgi:hypothetical protein
LALDAHEHLTAHAGIFLADGEINGSVTKFGGVGSVMTSPEQRCQGHGTAVMHRVKLTLQDLKVDAGLLFCVPDLFAFYSRLGWQCFDGEVTVDQPTGRYLLTESRPMLLSLGTAPPLTGRINVNGLPW